MSKSTQSVHSHMSVQEEIARTDLAQWKAVVSRIANPVTARLIVEALEQDAAAKAANLGVFLVARETVKRDQIRYARARRAGQLVGNVGRLAFQACRAVIEFASNGVSKVRGKESALKHVAPQGAPVTAQTTAPTDVRLKEETETLVFPTIIFSVPDTELQRVAVVH